MSAAPAAGVRRQFVWVLGSRVLASAVQATTVILLARSASVPEFGVVGIVLAVGAVVFTVADLGLSVYVLKARAQGRDDDLAAALRLNTLTTVVCGGLAALACAVYAADRGASLLLALLGVSLALEKNADCTTGVAVADGRLLTPAANLVLRRVVALAGFCGLLLAGVAAVPAFALAALAGAVASQAYVRVRIDVHPRRRVGLGAVARQAAMYLVNNVAAQTRLLDTAVVGAVLSTHDAGLYAGASRVSQPLMLVSTSANAVLMPHVARGGRRQASRVALTMAAATALACVAMLVPAALSDRLVVLLLGPEYAAAGAVLAATVLSFPVIALASPLATVLQGQGDERAVAVIGVVFAGVALLMTWCGAWLYGIAGAAAFLGMSFLAKCCTLLGRCILITRGREGDRAVPVDVARPTENSATGRFAR